MPRHPLDPLSAEEIAEAAARLRGAHDLGPGMRFETVTLDEPSPAEQAAFERGAPCQRRAFLAVYDTACGDLYEAVLLLGTAVPGEERLAPAPAGSAPVLRWAAIAGARPRIAEDEFLLAEQAALADPRFRAALAARGIEDLDLVCCDPWSSSVLGDPAEAEHRLVFTLAWLRPRAYGNQFARPIEGLSALVDIDRGEVVRVIDHGIVPLAPEDRDYAARFQERWRQGLRPIEAVQPEGPSFTVEGHAVRWCGWHLRIGFTAREGLVLHDVAIEDPADGRLRPVLRRAALAEMLVPYGSPNGAHPRKNAFDCGDYGIGALANSLALGCDCLGTIRYLDAVVNRTDGSARLIPSAICLHEEDTGILWKHTDWRTGEVEVRRGRRLVVSFIATVGNYEYAFYWHLQLDGTIALEVKLTGIINSSGIALGGEDPHGVTVAPGVVGHIHQHLFNVRLDMAVDGPDNTVLEVDTLLDPPDPARPPGNAARRAVTPLLTEKAARRDVDPARWRSWTIVNRGSLNAHGEPVGYRLVPHSTVTAMAAPGSQVEQRGGFALHHLWVTPTSPQERWPAGDYVNQSRPGEGLPRWTEADRSVADRPITVWHSFGHHHVPRPEDFPVQPVVSCGFALQPCGFFDRNPALDIPPPASKASRRC